MIVTGGGGNVDIQFGYAFYILLVGGLFSLGAASFNLLCARSAADRRRSLRLRFRYICYSSITVTNHPAKCSMTRIPRTQVLFLEFFFDTRCVFNNYREQQLRNRQQTESEGESNGPETRRTTTTSATRSNRRRRGVAPPVYSLIDTGSELTTDSEFEVEAETSLSEPEYSEHEPDLSPPPYTP